MLQTISEKKSTHMVDNQTHLGRESPARNGRGERYRDEASHGRHRAHKPSRHFRSRVRAKRVLGCRHLDGSVKQHAADEVLPGVYCIRSRRSIRRVLVDPAQFKRLLNGHQKDGRLERFFQKGEGAIVQG